MSTDAAILTAAREVAAAHAAIVTADSAKRRADAEVLACAVLAEAARKRYKLAETRLNQLACQKPAEPAPKADVVTLAAKADVAKLAQAVADAQQAEHEAIAREPPQIPIPVEMPADLKSVPAIPPKAVPTLPGKRR